ncbi:MAG TPA: DAK2 domain-containing protein [Candidatus Eisenbergiella stercorigallinarum]|uniref:DAK2 domain-containing protein n=1 Tax=Candidatus Eisenbergiella stercorigallinarum TaxID=2838557 RepID=A0A9D2QVF8_9FIRM|nr:DAK2 domain-containing protein [Candidatus Eisenbergiella stercorigallinarum]
MNLQTIDAGCLAKMFLAGAKRLESKKEWINELNVFPVPDGDTGTNMTLTIMSAAKEVAAMTEPDMKSLSKAVSSGSLRGARGNSGVILSQLFRGFTKGIRDYDVLTVPILADAGEKAVETAYKAVMKPKEGTILTVAKGASLKARELADAGEEDMEKFLSEIISHAEYVLSQTPEMLPVLKQAGVVDSGGQGLVEVLHGAFDAFTGKVSADSLDFSEQAKPAPSEGGVKGSLEAQAEMEIKFGYCTEFIIMLNKTFNIKQEMDFKAYLESIGDSIVVVADDDVVKVHVHTNDPGLAIQKALKYGALSNMKIDNMRLEHQEKLFKLSEKEKQAQEAPAAQEAAGEHKDAGFIAVSAGDGLAEIFRGLGVDYVIEGGQTMNPSTEDVVNAIGKVNADTVYVLPNNKNIILAASQAKYLVEDKNVVVVPTKTIPQGITAVINFVPDMGAEENEASMTEEISHVRTGEVTYAVRDTVIDDKQIRQGDYMGIGDDGILAVGSDVADVAYDMTAAMMDDDCELISIYYGADVTQEDAENLKARVEERYPSCDIELQYGGQPIYSYIISAE